MKPLYLTLWIFIFCVGLISCNNEESKNEQLNSPEQADLKTLKSFSKYVTEEIYLTAYDKRTGDIDIEKYDNIILSYNLDRNIDLSNSFKQPILTRGGNEVYDIINSDEFTEKQKEVFKKLFDIKKPTIDDYLKIKREVSSWDTEDKYLVIQTINNIISIIEGVEEGLDNINQGVQTRASAKAYICNAGVSMISGVTGFLAGALTAPTGAGPLVGYIVGGVVGTYLGANMC